MFVPRTATTDQGKVHPMAWNLDSGQWSLRWGFETHDPGVESLDGYAEKIRVKADKSQVVTRRVDHAQWGGPLKTRPRSKAEDGVTHTHPTETRRSACGPYNQGHLLGPGRFAEVETRYSHWEGPQVLAATLVKVQTALDDVPERGEVRASVRVHDALGPRGRPGRKGDGEHVVLMVGLGVEAVPALAAVLAVMCEALEDDLVKGPTQLALRGVGVLEPSKRRRVRTLRDLALRAHWRRG